MDGRCCKSGFGRVLCSRSSWFPHLFSAERGILKLFHRARWPFRGRRVMAYFNPVWKGKADLLYFYISFNEIYLQILPPPPPPQFPETVWDSSTLFSIRKVLFLFTLLLCDRWLWQNHGLILSGQEIISIHLQPRKPAWILEMCLVPVSNRIVSFLFDVSECGRLDHNSISVHRNPRRNHSPLSSHSSPIPQTNFGTSLL